MRYTSWLDQGRVRGFVDLVASFLRRTCTSKRVILQHEKLITSAYRGEEEEGDTTIVLDTLEI